VRSGFGSLAENLKDVIASPDFLIGTMNRDFVAEFIPHIYCAGLLAMTAVLIFWLRFLEFFTNYLSNVRFVGMVLTVQRYQ